MKDYRDLFVAPEQQEQLDPGDMMRPNYVPPTPSGWTSYGDMWRSLESRPERQGVPEWLGSYMGSDDLGKQQTATPAPTAAQPNTVLQTWKDPNEYEGQSGFHTDKTPEMDFSRMASEADAMYAAERQAKAPAKAAEPNREEHFKRSEQIDPMRGVVSITTPTVTVHEAQRFRTADDGSVFFRGADGEEYQMNPDDPNVQRAMAYDSRSAQPQAPAGDHWDAIRRAR
jgi:hypothetical protein